MDRGIKMNSHPTHCTYQDLCCAYYEQDKNCMEQNGRNCNLARFLDVEENRELIKRVSKKRYTGPRYDEGFKESRGFEYIL
jgi:hypothetical protein